MFSPSRRQFLTDRRRLSEAVWSRRLRAIEEHTPERFNYDNSRKTYSVRFCCRITPVCVLPKQNQEDACKCPDAGTDHYFSKFDTFRTCLHETYGLWWKGTQELVYDISFILLQIVLKYAIALANGLNFAHWATLSQKVTESGTGHSY